MAVTVDDRPDHRAAWITDRTKPQPHPDGEGSRGVGHGDLAHFAGRRRPI